MLNILREVDRDDLEILDVETLMKLYEKQMKVRGANVGHQSYLQVIWRKLYETYFIKKDLQCNDKLPANMQGAYSAGSRVASREGGLLLRSRAE